MIPRDAQGPATISTELASCRADAVPVLLLIDVEPDGFFVDRGARLLWSGFERAMEWSAAVRDVLTRSTRRDTHFTWLVRADPQIAEVYGSPAWALEHYADALQTLLANGDEVGLHQHAYRWLAADRRWVEDYGNQEWVNHCIRVGVDAFETHFGRRPDCFSMGMDWTSQATIQLIRELQIRFDFSAVLGKEPQSFPPRDTYTGTAPDCSRIPRRPYRPSASDFRIADGQTDGLWIFPQSSRVARIYPSLKRRIWDLVHLRPLAPPCTRKLFLQDDPEEIQPALGQALRSVERPYLTFAVRTHEFRDPAAVSIIRRNLEGVLTHAHADRFVFAAPAEALALLGYAGTQQ
jgi:hypothetical protein